MERTRSADDNEKPEEEKEVTLIKLAQESGLGTENKIVSRLIALLGLLSLVSLQLVVTPLTLLLFAISIQM